MPRPMRYGAKAKRMQAFVSPETFSALTDRAARSNCSVGEVIDALVQDANGEGGPVSRRGVLRAALREGETPPTPLDPDRPLEGMTLRMEPPPQFFTPEQVREQAQRLIKAVQQPPTVQPAIKSPEQTTVSSGGHVWRKAGKVGSECVHCSKTSKNPLADTSKCPGGPS